MYIGSYIVLGLLSWVIFVVGSILIVAILCGMYYFRKAFM
jgi:hypothetical protein